MHFLHYCCACELIAGEYQIGNNTYPLDPSSVASVVYYGTLYHCLNREAKGHSLVYNQLYPFKGLQNYTSGIIHHVRLTGILRSYRTAYACSLMYIGKC